MNEAQSIEKHLKPLQIYRQRNCEIILVDGRSCDQTAGIAKKYVDKILISEEGRAKQMNKGAENAFCPILLFLHADTYLPEQADSIILRALDGNNHWGRFDVSFNDNHLIFKIIAFAVNMRSRITGIATGDQAIFIQTDIFNYLNGYKEIPLMEDVELSTRLNKISRPICLRNKVITSSRRWRQSGILKTILKMWFLRIAFYFGMNTEKLAKMYGAE